MKQFKSMIKSKKLFKSGLAIIAAVCLFISTFTFLTNVYPLAESNVWGGQSDLSAPVDSDNDGVYEITKGAELAYIIKNGGSGANYILTNDIYLNDVTKVNWETGVAESGYSVNSWYGNYESTPFSGTIDGNGHIVYGLYFNIGTSYGNYVNYTVGLIPEVTGTASITSLGVDKAFINYESYASAFIGSGKAGVTANVDCCYVGKDVYITAYGVGAFRGAAKDMTTNISNSFSCGSFVAKGGAYGVASIVWGNLNISNSYNANGPILSDSNSYQVMITDSYQTSVGGVNTGVTTLTLEKMKGTDVFTAADKMPALNANDKFVAGEGLPTLKGFSNDVDNPLPSSQIWGGNTDLTAPVDSDSDGTYEISKASELAYIVKNGGAGKNYIITSDIYLNDVTKVNWKTGTPESGYTVNSWYGNYETAAFSGSIDGNGHVVYGLYFNIGSSYGNYINYAFGLIPGVTGNVEIKNLGVDKAFINYESYAAVFVGYGSSGTTTSIDSCYVGSDVFVTAYTAGAFRGASKDMTTNVANCYSLATLTSKGGTFGLVPYVWGHLNISNSYNANGPIVSDTNGYQVTIADSYQTVAGGVNTGATIIVADKMKGADVFTAADKMPALNANNKFVAGDDFPTLKSFTTDSNDDNTGGETPAPDDNEGKMPGPVDEIVWGGHSDLSAPIDSDGDGVYEISKASEFAYVVKNGGEGKKYKLTADIYLNDTSKINWKSGAVAEGYTVNSWFDSNNSAKFKGSINGAGHTVYGMYYKGNNSSFSHYVPYSIGIIPYVDSDTAVEIVNLGVDGAYIWYECYASAFVGSAGTNGAPSAVSFENCYAGKNVYITAYSAAAFRGYTYDGDTLIKNSYSFGSYTANGGHTGFIAKVWGLTEILNSYNANGPIISDNERYNVSIKNSYQTVTGGGLDSEAYTISAENMQGLDVLVNADKMSKLNEDSVYIETDTYPINYVFTDAYTDNDDINSNVWDGTVATALNGSGTENDPYLISNGAELAFAIKNGGNGAYYKIIDDIYLNDVEKVDWKTGKASVIGYRINPWFYNVSFDGYLDGDGHIVYGLYYKTKEVDTKFFWGHYGVGLIPRVDAGKTVSISKLGIDNAYVSFECGSAAFVGYAGSGSKTIFDQCFVGANAVVRGNSAGALRGLPVESEIIVNNCYSAAEIVCHGTNAVRGLIGNVWGKVAVRNAFNANGPISSSYERYNVLFEECYQTEQGTDDESGVVTLAAKNMCGQDSLSNSKKMPDLNTYLAFISTESYPVLNIFYGGEGAISFTDEGVKGRVWSGKLATKFAGGVGTKAEPYLIETPEQLAYLIAGGGGFEGAYYKLTADIKLNDTSKANWQEKAHQWFAGMGIFRGVFDGNGHVVSGLYYNGEENGSAYAAGLFQRLGCDSVVMRVGLVNSKIYANSREGIALAGAIVGWAEDYNPDGNPNKKAPVISECFAGDDVFVQGTSAGGILGAAPTLAIVENCYFTGELTAKNFAGAIVGDAWHGDGHGPVVKNCYAATLDRNAIGAGDAFRQKDVEAGMTTITNVYVDGIDLSGAANLLSVMYMRGEEAKNYMKGFDFITIWKTVENGSPVLRCFDSDKYSSTREPAKVTISFGNMGGLKFDSISGIPGYTKIVEGTIPTPYRYGFLFKGWHHFNEYGADFELDVFPEFDITLYAAWEEVGFTVGFEGDLDEKYDYNSGIEVYKPGLVGFKSDYIQSGWNSLHAKADSTIQPSFLISYDNPLEVGKEYHLAIWMATDDATAEGVVKLIHTNYPDVNDEILGSHVAFEYSGLTVGEWKKYEVTFVANAPYVLVSSPVGQSLYFDSVKIVPTGNSGEPTKLDNSKTDVSNDPVNNEQESNSGLIIILIVAGAVVLLAGVLTFVIIRRKKSK